MENYNIDPEYTGNWKDDEVYNDIPVLDNIVFDTDKVCNECTDDGNCSDVGCPFYHHQQELEDNK